MKMFIASAHDGRVDFEFRPVTKEDRNDKVKGQTNSSKSWKEVVGEDAIIMISPVRAIQQVQKGYMDLTAWYCLTPRRGASRDIGGNHRPMTMDCLVGLLLAVVGLPNRGSLQIRRHVKLSHRVQSRRVSKTVTLSSPMTDLFLVVDVEDAKARIHCPTSSTQTQIKSIRTICLSSTNVLGIYESTPIDAIDAHWNGQRIYKAIPKSCFYYLRITI